MNLLLNRDIDVTIVSKDGKANYGEGILNIKESTVIKTKQKLNEENLKVLVAILQNDHVVILVHGILSSTSSGSFHNEYQYRFYEALYYETNKFEDKFLRAQCRILLLNNWFKRDFYKIQRLENETLLKVENESSFLLKYKNFTLTVYYSSIIHLGRPVSIAPQTSLVIESESELVRHELFKILNNGINFFQCFFYRRFDLFNLSYSNSKINVISHSYKIPYSTNAKYSNSGIIWFSFDELHQHLGQLFENWMKHNEENILIEELFSDAFNNNSPVNRFLSSLRILEILSKRICDDKIELKAKEWKKNIAINQVLREREKKFSQYWILKPLILYRGFLMEIADSEIIDVINNRNYYTHRGYKIGGVLSASKLQPMTNKILAYSKTIFFLQLGIKREFVKRVMPSLNLSYFLEPVDNETSSFYIDKNSTS